MNKQRVANNIEGLTRNVLKYKMSYLPFVVIMEVAAIVVGTEKIPIGFA